MKQFAKWGAWAAFVCGATYVFGFALMIGVLAESGYGTDGADVDQILAFVTSHAGLMTIWNMSIYVLNGLALAALAVCLSEVLRYEAPHAAPMIKTFGALWATLVVGAGMVANVGLAEVTRVYAEDPDAARSLWQVVSIVENGLGGGNEIAGGVWALIVSAAAASSPRFSKALVGFGAAVGLAGLLTLVPAFGDAAGAIFGLGFIVWFFWVAAVLGFKRSAAAVATA